MRSLCPGENMQSKWQVWRAFQGKRDSTGEGELQHAFRTLRLWQLTLDTIVLLSRTKQMGFLSYGHIMRNGSLFMECLPLHVTLGSFPHFLYPSSKWGVTPHFDLLLHCWLGPQKSSNDLENQPKSRARCPQHCGEVNFCPDCNSLGCFLILLGL